MGILKTIDKSQIAYSAEEAVRILLEDHRVFLYDYNHKKLQKIISEIYPLIKKHNLTIPDIDNQILTCSPYYWDDIDGCLAVRCAEIDAGLFKDMAGGLFIFTEPRYDVLSDKNARKPLSSKALTTLAMMGQMFYDRDYTEIT